MEETFKKITELSSIQSEKLTKFKDIAEYEICLLNIERHIDAAILLFNNGFLTKHFYIIV